MRISVCDSPDETKPITIERQGERSVILGYNGTRLCEEVIVFGVENGAILYAAHYQSTKKEE
jgi:hypothetical protein